MRQQPIHGMPDTLRTNLDASFASGAARRPQLTGLHRGHLNGAPTDTIETLGRVSGALLKAFLPIAAKPAKFQPDVWVERLPRPPGYCDIQQNGL